MEEKCRVNGAFFVRVVGRKGSEMAITKQGQEIEKEKEKNTNVDHRVFVEQNKPQFEGQ